GVPQIDEYTTRAVALEEHPLTGERRERDHDVDLASGLPGEELVLQRDRRHEAADIAAALDRRDVDRHRVVQTVKRDGMTRFVDRDRVPLALDVLHVVGNAMLLVVL